MNIVPSRGVRLAVIALFITILTGVLAFFPTTKLLAPATLAEHANPFALDEKPEGPGIGHFIEVMGGCGPDYAGACVTARTGPGEEYAETLRLRAGMVLKVAATTTLDGFGHPWHEVVFSEWVRYPGRLGGALFVPAASVREFLAPEYEELTEATATTTKRILVSRSEQKLYAYDGDELAFSYPVSTGLTLTPTPRGEFVIFRKTPSRYMQGPLPGVSSQYYDLPGVPWALYFTKEGATIHGAYWHDNFGAMWSHGCVNLAQDAAHAVYDWAPVGTPVTVRD